MKLFKNVQEGENYQTALRTFYAIIVQKNSIIS